MASNDYIQRLKDIRSKYGCSNALNIDSSTLPYSESMNIASNTPYRTEARKQNQRAIRERQIERIKQNYAESRQKVISNYSSKDYQPKNNHVYEENHKFLEPTITSRYQPYSYQNEQSMSPIKRVKEYSNGKPNHYSKETDRRLEEVTLNRAFKNTNIPAYQNRKIENELYSRPSYEHRTYEERRSKGKTENYQRYEHDKKGGEYSVSNIDKIQQRIHSILGKH